LRWIRERLGTYGWSKVDWITVRRRVKKHIPY
jgi:hypothetical protein